VRLLLAYWQLTKPRLTALVIMTSVAGYFLAGPATFWEPRLFYLVAGAVLSCSGAAVLNQYLERDLDARMRYTCNRPIPAGIVRPVHALNFSILLILTGITVLCVKVNLLTAFLSLLTVFIYIMVYTPMKRVSWLSTSLGAVAGALPPVGGWAAVSGTIGLEAWILFFILFIWQHLHFYAIAWMHRQDYKAAGFKILSVIDPEGRRIFKHVFVYSLVLVPVALLPYVFGVSGGWYGAGAIMLGIILLIFSAKLFFSRSDRDTRVLFRATVAYLPALLMLIILDKLL
jgi:protoheme IX farnesyltransferase